MLLAAPVSPDNTPHGYNLTFAFPMLLFIIVAGLLYLRFRGPHKVPGHVALASSRWATTTPGTVKPHSEALASEPVSSVVAATEPAHGATVLDDRGGEDVADEGTAPDSTAPEGTAPESTAHDGTAPESTED